MSNQEVLIGASRSLLNTIIFGIGCIGLLLFFVIALVKSKSDIFILFLDLAFSFGFGAFCYRSFEKYKIFKKFKIYGKIQ